MIEGNLAEYQPISTPRYAVTRCSIERWSTSASTLPMLVSTAARPTTECSAATICGSSVAVMRRPSSAPMREPMPATPANWVRTSGENPTARRDARMPEETPNMPRMLPCLAVCCEARPESEPGMQIKVSKVLHQKCEIDLLMHRILLTR